MMITGMRSHTARTPLTSPRRPPNATPIPAAIHGSTPATIALAAMTAEKLNIHPTERSISRMATTKTIASASIPMKAAPDSCWNSVAGRKKLGRSTPTITTSVTSATRTPVSSGRPRSRRAGRDAGAPSTGSGSVADVPAVTCLLTSRVPRSHGRVSVRQVQPAIESRDRRYRKRFDEIGASRLLSTRPRARSGVRQLFRRSDA